ncbi:inositol monophosphatase family protein [Reichenbachiella sp.]|uniref:inositol monophosphatase family protein n=1 Tax=Reichenbachiella sp. TaxID=2184521 RepID=UPI003BB06656
MKLSTKDIETLAQVALDAAKKAVTFIQSKVTQSHNITLKDGVENLATQVVTAVDIESQRIILELLEPTIKIFDLGLLTEELPDDNSRFTKDYFWCIDPLDGTLPFTEQEPGYAVSIALINKAGEPIMGAVLDPYQGDNWVAIRGRGVMRNQSPYKFTVQSKTLVISFDRSFLSSAEHKPTIDALELIREKLGFDYLEIGTGYGAVMNAMRLLTAGSGCYVKWPKATRGGGYIWDYAATRLIYEELNLPVSTALGNPIPLNQRDPYMNKHGVLYATSDALHEAILEVGKPFN